MPCAAAIAPAACPRLFATHRLDRYIAAGAVVGIGVGGAATFFYLRSQQQRAVRPTETAAAGGFAGVASHPALKHGELGGEVVVVVVVVGMHALAAD